MKILSMTATFGKLDNQTLKLNPELNVIHAPNEWGKSTWSAFILCMLYGIDTKERTTMTAMADKERYAPWSGKPMSGRMDLCWEGRNITIERSSTSRVPFGEFRAYETESGLPVPELTASNCGQVLLGVEKSVFQRAGFLRLTDLPVTQDEALRRRLNALVTTGDESGVADELSEKLKNLKNKCRHNKTGLIPQAEKERDALAQNLERLQQLQQTADRIQEKLAENEKQTQLLKNHKQMLAYEASLADAEKVQQADTACQELEDAYSQLEAYCQTIPTIEAAQEGILNLQQLQMDQEDLQAEALPPVPELPETPAMFLGMTPKQALMQAQSSEETYNILKKSQSPLLLILGILALVATIPTAFFLNKTTALILLVVGAALAAIHIRQGNSQKQQLQLIAARYGDVPPEKWVETAQSYCDAMAQYENQEKAYRDALASLQDRKERLQEMIDSFTDGHTISQCIDEWEKIIATHNRLMAAYQDCVKARHHAQALREMAKLAPKPDVEDELTYNAAQTEQLLGHYAAELRQLQLQLGQCTGQIEAMGQEAALQAQLQAVQLRLEKLENTYAALDMAIHTLEEASAELQRKFAPRITQRAKTLFSRLTGGRYNQLLLTQDLRLEAAAESEIGTRPSRTRSDGTVDQLYLALRLAVAEELTPEAPLVLDDALVRFDDTRLAAAMEILREEAQQKQVILFSCQGRELA